VCVGREKAYDGQTVVFLENACSHLSFRECFRGFNHLLGENLPLCFMLLGWRSIAFASSRASSGNKICVYSVLLTFLTHIKT
jgi:hypothetical protein